MDQRLDRLPPGLRARPIMQGDVPQVAQALALALRGRASTQSMSRRGQALVLISGERVQLAILDADWMRIRPFLADGTFEPSLVPRPGVDIDQDPLYQRILDTLLTVFTEDFPHD